MCHNPYMGSIYKHRNINVDALRFLCALCIVILHTWGAFLDAKILPAVIRHSLGYSVNIFFIISGYAINESLKAYTPTLRNAMSYVLRRSVRLDAPYWFMLALYFMLETMVKQRNYGFFDLFANAAYMQRIFEFQQIVGVAWTLCIEVQFYLLMLLIASFRKTTMQALLILSFIIVGSLVMRHQLGLFLDGNFVFQFLPWFILGIVASSAHEFTIRKSITIVIGLLVSQCLLDGSDFTSIAFTTIYGTISYIVIARTHPQHPASAANVSPSVSKLLIQAAGLSLYTYSTYLTHMLAIKCVTKMSFLPQGFSKFSTSLMLTGVLSFALYKLIEKPAIDVSRRISYSR
jgi:peptidoglycan/LPS O-acetylase OafA/YrhL